MRSVGMGFIGLLFITSIFSCAFNLKRTPTQSVSTKKEVKQTKVENKKVAYNVEGQVFIFDSSDVQSKGSMQNSNNFQTTSKTQIQNTNSYSNENTFESTSNIVDYRHYQKPPYFPKSKKEAYCLSKVLKIQDDIRAFTIYASPTAGFRKDNPISEYKYRFLYLIENYDNPYWKQHKQELLKEFLDCLQNPEAF